MRRRKPNAPVQKSELDYGDELIQGFGGVSAHEIEIELTVTERNRLRKERREALERKRPLGFTADWTDQEGHTDE